MNTRGINHIHCCQTVHCKLNHRLMSCLESNNKLSDEQSAYRKGRNCVDNLFVLISVTRERNCKTYDTFACFAYFSASAIRQYDTLIKPCWKFSVKGNSHNALCLSMHSHRRIEINGYLTNWFSTECSPDKVWQHPPYTVILLHAYLPCD